MTLTWARGKARMPRPYSYLRRQNARSAFIIFTSSYSLGERASCQKSTPLQPPFLLSFPIHSSISEIPHPVPTKSSLRPFSSRMSLTSAAGLLAWLSEPEVEIRSWALQKLNECVDLLWPEISGAIGQMYVHRIVIPLRCLCRGSAQSAA